MSDELNFSNPVRTKQEEVDDINFSNPARVQKTVSQEELNTPIEEEEKFVPRIVEGINAETASKLYDGSNIPLDIANETKAERDRKEAFAKAQNYRIIQDANKDHRKATAIQDDYDELGRFEEVANKMFSPQSAFTKPPTMVEPQKDTNFIEDITGATVSGVIDAGKDIYKQATDPNVTSISDAITAGVGQDDLMVANNDLLWLTNTAINNPDDVEAQQAVANQESYIRRLEGEQPKTPYTVTAEAFKVGSGSFEMLKDVGLGLGTVVGATTVTGSLIGTVFGKTPVAKGIEYLDRKFGADLPIDTKSGAKAGFKLASILAPWEMARQALPRAVGETYGELNKIVDDNKKPLPHDVKFGASLVAGVAKTALESTGLMYMFKQTGIGKTIIERIAKDGVSKLVREEGARAIFASIGKRMAKASAVEATQESFQTVIDIIATEFAKLSSDENEFKKILGAEYKDGEYTKVEGMTRLDHLYDFAKEKSPDVGHSALLAVIVGGGFTGVGASINELANKGIDYTKGKYENQQIKTMSDVANKTKTMQRNRQLMEDLSEGILKDKEFKIPANKIKEYFQSDDELTAFLEDNPSIATQWEQQSSLYGDINLPANKALSIFSDERYTGLREYAVMSDDSILEADLDEDFEHRIKKGFELEEKQNKELDEINNIVSSLQGSIEKAGETKQTANAVGSLYKALLETGKGDTKFYEKLKERVVGLEVEADFGFEFTKGDKTRESLIKAREGKIQERYEKSQAGITEAYRKTGESIFERARNVKTPKQRKVWIEQEAKAIYEELKNTRESLPPVTKKGETLRGLIKASGGINPYAAMGLTQKEVGNIKSATISTNLKQRYNELVEKFGTGIFSYKAPATNGFDWAEQIGRGSQFQVEDIQETLANGGDMVNEVEDTERSDAETYFNDTYSVRLDATLKDIKKQLETDLTYSKDGSSYFGDKGELFQSGISKVYTEKFRGKVEEVKLLPPQILKATEIKEMGNLPKIHGFDNATSYAESISLNDPIDVSVYSDGEIMIQDGHHRWLAAKQLGKNIKVKLTSINAKPERLNELVQLSESLSDLNKPDLFVSHNLSAENLKHADELGGLAVPSLAIARTSTGGFESFGEISLIADKDLIDPKLAEEAKTFNADIYSPRFPRASFNVNDKAMRKATLELEDISKEIGSGYFNLEIEDNGLGGFLNSELVQYRYLKSIGKAPAIKMKKKPKLPKELKNKYKGKSKHAISDAPEFIEVATKYYENWARELAGRTNRDYAEWIDSYLDMEGNVYLRHREALADKIVEANSPKQPDEYANRDAIRKKMEVKKTRTGFEEWVENEYHNVIDGKRIFDGYTYSGTPKFKSFDMDTIVKIMKQGLRDGEAFNYGVGSLRSNVAKQFKSVKQIQASREDIQSKESFEKVKKETDDEFFALTEELKPYYKYEAESFGYTDDALNSFKEFASKGVRGLNEYYESLPEKQLKKVGDFMEKLRNMPTEYFETKVQRAVGIGEFKGAVVPHDVSKETIALLKKNGITKIKRYGGKDKAGRSEVIEKFFVKELFQETQPDIDPLDDNKGEWRYTDIGVTTPEGKVNVKAGEVVDILNDRIKVAKSLLDCVMS